MVVTKVAELPEQVLVLNPLFLSSQLAVMPSSQDLKIIVTALQLSKTLLTKLPDQFSVHFGCDTAVPEFILSRAKICSGFIIHILAPSR